MGRKSDEQKRRGKDMLKTEKEVDVANVGGLK